jgi:hypothetical protein
MIASQVVCPERGSNRGNSETFAAIQAAISV